MNNSQLKKEYLDYCSIVENLPNFSTIAPKTYDEFVTMKKENLDIIQSTQTIYDICNDSNIIKKYEEHCELVNNLPNFSSMIQMSPEEFVKHYNENNLKSNVQDNISKIRENSLNTTIPSYLSYYK